MSQVETHCSVLFLTPIYQKENPSSVTSPSDRLILTGILRGHSLRTGLSLPLVSGHLPPSPSRPSKFEAFCKFQKAQLSNWRMVRGSRVVFMGESVLQLPADCPALENKNCYTGRGKLNYCPAGWQAVFSTTVGLFSDLKVVSKEDRIYEHLLRAR